MATTSTLGMVAAGMMATASMSHAAGATGISITTSPPYGGSDPFTITGTVSQIFTYATPPLSNASIYLNTALHLQSYTGFTGGVLNRGTVASEAILTGTVTVGAKSCCGGQPVPIGVAATGLSGYADPSFTGGFDNAGTISAAVMMAPAFNFTGGGNGVDLKGTAQGFWLETSSFSGGISNSGQITASATAAPVTMGVTTGNSVGSNTLAQAIYISGEGIPGSFQNGIVNSPTGAIEATATVSSGAGAAQAQAIDVDEASFSGGISNAGMVSAVASAPVGNVLADTYATGINIEGASAFAGGIVNTGVVRAAVNGPSAKAIGINISASSFAGGIANTGTIGATAVGANAKAFGIYVASGAGPGTITNSGTIAVSGGAGSAAIDLVGATTATIIDQKAGAIIGNIDFSTNKDNLVATGGLIDGSIIGDGGGTAYTTDGQTVTVSGAVTFGCPGSAPSGCAGIADVQSVGLTGGSLILTPSAVISSVGTFAQSRGSTLVLEVYAPGVGPTDAAAPSITAKTVSLAGALEIDPLAPVVSTEADQYQSKNTYASIIVASAGDSDKLTSVTSNTPLLTPSVTDRSGHYTITLTRLAFGNVAGLTSAERSFGTYLEGLYDKGQDLSSIDPLFAMNASQYIAYLKSGSAPASTVTRNQATQSTQSFATAIENRLQSAGAFDGSGFTLGLGETDAPDETTAGRASFASSGGNETHWGVWSHAYGLSSDGMVGMGGAGFAQATGGIIGYDAKLSPRLVVGVAADYVRSAWDFDQGIGNDRQGQYQLAAYSRYTAGAWHLSGVAGFGYADYNGAGGGSGPGFLGTDGPLDGSDMMAHAELGYDVRQPGVTVTPLAGLGYTGWRLNAVGESGFGAANLETNATDSWSLASSLGARVATQFELAGAHIASDLQVAWQHTLAGEAGLVTEQFAGAASGASFAEPGAPLARDSAVIGLGLTGALSASTRLFLDYDGTLDRVYPNHTLSAGFKTTF
jgi:uncharacterized protein with beta-barrel porin domain